MTATETRGDLGYEHVFVPAEDGGGWTLLLLHSTDGDERQLLELGRRVAPRAALLSPRGKELENAFLPPPQPARAPHPGSAPAHRRAGRFCA